MSEIIVALDAPSREEALSTVEALGEEAGFYKVGLELFTAEGPSLVGELRSLGKRVFLDLKLHDIPRTVAGAVAAASRHGAELLTVHVAGGGAMLEAAAREAGRSGIRLLGVTVLTSLDSGDLETVWGRSGVSAGDEVERLARWAVASGLDGVVASPREARALRHRLGSSALIVTPGIRATGAEPHDQRRVATPAEAAAAGADALVVGRSVTEAPDPRGRLRAIRQEAAAPAADGAGRGP